MRAKLYFLEFLLFFPALVAHEAMHAIFAWMLGGNIQSIRLFPKRVPEGILFGSVDFSARFQITFMIASIAPLFLFIPLFFILQWSGVFILNGYDLDTFKLLSLLPYDNMLYNLYLWVFVAQVFWAAKLSTQDVKVFLTSLFSIEGFLIIGVIYFFYTKS